MEKIIEKLGLYDTWTIIFPGAIFLILLKTIYQFMVLLGYSDISVNFWIKEWFNIIGIQVYYPETIYELFVFLLLSYWAGIILHEIGSIIKKNIIYRNGNPTELLLDPESKVLSQQQINLYMPMFLELHGGSSFADSKKRKKQREESKRIFAKMNARLQTENIASKYVKLNIIHNMCVTLWIVVVLLIIITLAFIIEFIFNGKWQAIYNSGCVMLVLIVGSVILFCRSKKYYIYWTKNIVYAYSELYIKEKESSD